MSKHWTWEKVKAEMDAAIADDAVEYFVLSGTPAALFLKTKRARAESPNLHGITGYFLPYRGVDARLNPSGPDDVKAVRTAR